ncbi:MAG: pteridine reductase [Pseudomonadota bacterium]
MPLSGKSVLVTGAARRLGAAMVRAFHGAGANVAIHYRSSGDEAEALCDVLNGLRPNSAMTVALDLNDSDALPRLPRAVHNRFGSLDGLVNNASSFFPTPVGDITQENWDDLVGSNLKAPVFLTQAAAPLLTESSGFVINMVDIHASRPLKDHPVYCAAKAGLHMFTRSMARELGPAVRVNGIAPGPVLWPETDMSDDDKADIVQDTALQRCGDESDIVQAAMYLATAGFVTGQIIAVDGGRSV